MQLYEAVERAAYEARPRIVTLDDRAGALAALRRYLDAEEPGVMRLVRGLWREQAAALTPKMAEWTLSIRALPAVLTDEWFAQATELWEEKLGAVIEAALEAAGGRMARRINEARKQTFAFDATGAAVVKWMTEHGGALIRELSASQAASINALLQHQVFIGITSPYHLAPMIRPMVGLLRRETLAVARYRVELVAAGLTAEKVEARAAKYAAHLHRARAERIARTELSNAYNHGQLEAMRQARDDGYLTDVRKTWETALDELTCPECSALNGETVGLDENFSNGLESSPAHPRCLLPSTRCITPGGFVSGVRARFSGPVVELVFSGNSKISVTPNHMFLTPNGFAAAYQLRKGDDIFYCPDFERILSGHPYNNGAPSLIEDVIGAFSESLGMTTRIVPVTAEDIHGDGRFCNGDIDIIGPDGLLGNTGKAFFFQHGKALPFDPGSPDAALFPGDRDFTAMFKSMARAADGIMGGLRKPSAFFGRRATHADEHGHASIAGLDAAFQEPPSNSAPRDVERLGQCLFRFPGLIATDKIVDVQYFSFHGFVYDLQTPTSLYIANGLLSSNCRCSVTYQAARR